MTAYVIGSSSEKDGLEHVVIHQVITQEFPKQPPLPHHHHLLLPQPMPPPAVAGSYHVMFPTPVLIIYPLVVQFPMDNLPTNHTIVDILESGSINVVRPSQEKPLRHVQFQHWQPRMLMNQAYYQIVHVT